MQKLGLIFSDSPSGGLRQPLLICLLTLLTVLPRTGHAWSKPHETITKAAVEVLPAWQKELLGPEAAALSSYYCTIPDLVQNFALLADKGDAKFAMMDSQPDKVYLLNLHLPAAEQQENLETLRYFVGKAVAALKEGKTGDAARFMGTISHQIEDFGSPSHTVPGDNMFTLLQQFLPPPEHMGGKLLHGPIESGDFELNIKGYQPLLLGVTVEETAWRLLHRVHEVILNARSTTVPIIQGLYARDEEAVLKNQLKAATLDAQVLADALYTILCLGADKLVPHEADSLNCLHMANHFPIEALNLYYPQSHFFSSPYWGHARSGVTLKGGTEETPLILSTAAKDGVHARTFTQGISTGMGRPLTFLLPKGVYRAFSVFAGLHSQLGASGKVEFEILGDGKSLVKATVSGTEPAKALSCDIIGVTHLQLATTGRSLDPKSNYAIWAVPYLMKKRPIDE